MSTPPGATISQRLIAAFVAAIATALFMNFAGLFGMVSSVFYLFVAVPVAYVYMRFGFTVGIGAFALTVIVLSGMYGLSNTFFDYVPRCGLPSLALPYFLRRGWRWDQAVALAVGVTVILAAALVTTVVMNEGTTITAFYDSYVESQLIIVRDFFVNNQELTPELQRELRLSFQVVEERFRSTYLAFVVLGFAALTLFQVWMLVLLSGRHYIVSGDAFVAWKVPESLIWGLIVSGFIYFVADDLPRQVGLNIMIILLFIYYVQGLAIITDLFERRRFPMFLRVLGYAMTIILGPLPFAGIGVFDLWVDFRKIRIKGT